MAAVKRSSVDDAQAAASGADEVQAIFLSHSGKQKAFVESLYNALLCANHTPFFDKHSLPKGSPFPPHIKRAALGCKLGVVVLSDEFLTSKWPMLELEMLALQRGPNPILLPLFYKLRPEDLKSHEKLSEWRRTWKENAGEHAGKWEQAVNALCRYNGELFNQGTSEDTYIKRVVRWICNLVPSPNSYDLSHIQGHRRFALMVESQFEEAARHGANVYSMVGLYGVGGLGKTTMCKVMTHFYNARCLGKSCHIEFPSDGDEKKIVQECKKALQKLTNLSDEHLLNHTDGFDQVVQLMKQHLRRHEVFLAIDNVWKSSVEAAKRILEVSFSTDSKILLTSPSEEVVKDLVRGHSNTSVGPLPSPNEDEAFQIFQKNFELGDLHSLVNRKLLDSALKRCFFSGNYHALALKTLGKYAKRVCAIDRLDRIEHSLSCIVQEIGEETEVEDLIRLNYEGLVVEKQHMFLDIVTVVRPEATCAEARLWLSILYRGSSETKIANIIYELALDGLIQLENIDDKSAERMIRVHDLYSDLAQKEAAKSDRFLTDVSTKSAKEIEWKKLQRVIVRERHLSSHFIEELQQQECPKLQVLCAKNIHFTRGIDVVARMPSLCVLKLESGTVTSINSSGATGLAIVHLSDLEYAGPIPSCRELILDNTKIVKVGGLSPALKNVVVCRCGALKRMPDSSGLPILEKLELSYNESMEEVGPLSPALKYVEVRGCEALKKMPDLSGLNCLETLELFDNRSMEEVGGLSPALKNVEVRRCGALKKMPDLSGLPCLETLELSNNESMEEVGGLSPALKAVRINGCGALKRMPDVSGLTCLQSLELEENESMEEVGGENLSSSIESLGIHRCRSLRRFPSLNECVQLEALIARACLKNERGHATSTEAEYVMYEELMSGVMTHLQSLTIKECDTLLKLEVGCLPWNLKYLHVNACKALEEIIGDLSELHSLRTLVLSDCPSLKRSGALCIPNLHRYDVVVVRCGNLLGSSEATPGPSHVSLHECSSEESTRVAASVTSSTSSARKKPRFT